MHGWQEGHSALKKHIPLILLEEENLRRNQLTWVHPEKWPLMEVVVVLVVVVVVVAGAAAVVFFMLPSSLL